MVSIDPALVLEKASERHESRRSRLLSKSQSKSEFFYSAEKRLGFETDSEFPETPENESKKDGVWTDLQKYSTTFYFNPQSPSDIEISNSKE